MALGLVLLGHTRAVVMGLRNGDRVDDAVLRRVQAQLDAAGIRLGPVPDPA